MEFGPDLSSRDAPTHVAMINLLYPRPGIPIDLFYEYWSAGHTQISSRLPGIHQYFEHHVSYEDGKFWPDIDGIDRHLAPEEVFYGDAELTFASSEDLDRFSAALNPLMQDEQNVFRKTISYQAVGENAGTLFDRLPEDSPNGDLAGVQKFMLYVQAADGVSREEFRRVLKNEVAPAFAGSEHVAKVRLRLPEYYDNSEVTLLAPNVSNHATDEEQYQGVIEIAFETLLQLRYLSDGGTWRVVTEALRKVARAMHPFLVLRTFTVYNHGEVTTAGLRTPAVAEQIRRLGAINQIGQETVDLIMARHTQIEDLRRAQD